MSFWSSETVKQRVPEQSLIEPYDPQRVMRGAYELSVGSEAYITSTTGEKAKLGDGDRIVIPPGQFGLLVTHEIVAVPNNAMGFLSIKSTTKLQGLVNVSGFHVDPGYKNTLKFAVYNAGSQNIYLDQGQPMFLIWYASLDQVTADLYTARPGLSKNITAEDVKRIAGDVASPAQLKKQIDEVKNDYDKRLQSVEQMQRILQWLTGALIILIIGTMLRMGWLDRVVELTNRSNALPQANQRQAGAITTSSPNPVVLSPGTSTFSGSGYAFERGFPVGDTATKAYDEADLNLAVEAYRFFYPSVSGSAIFKGNAKLGIVPNKVFGTLDSQPKHIGFTLNSDTPYAPLILDLSEGPMVVELPAGPLICIAMDINQLWVADLGLPGPSSGKGDKVVFLPPGYTETSPAEYRAARSTSNKMLIGVRSLPVNGDVPGAIDRIKTIKVYPLGAAATPPTLTWLNLTPQPQDTTPLACENNMQYWRELAEVINSEPVNPRFHYMNGELAALGIEKGKPFVPDSRMTRILEQAAKIGNAQMRVASFSDRRPDRVVWPDRKWEWAALRFENGDFNTANYADLHARDKWFYQAIGASPAMFKRDSTAGSLYWLGLRDASGATLDGGRTYKLTVPQLVPGKLFWSVTVYDTDTRSQVITDQGKAAIRSLFELKGKISDSPIDLYFGPTAPAGHEGEWIKTIPSKGWFTYFRIYGPEQPAFDGSWKPGDFEEVK